MMKLNRKKLQLLLFTALALSSIAPIVVAGCYDTATGIANYSYDGGVDCTPTQTYYLTEDGHEHIYFSCAGAGCFQCDWPNYNCDGPTDTSPLSCAYCNEEYADVNGYIEIGYCQLHLSFDGDGNLLSDTCSCETDPNNGTVFTTSGMVTNTGSDCEMCPERTGS